MLKAKYIVRQVFVFLMILYRLLPQIQMHWMQFLVVAVNPVIAFAILIVTGRLLVNLMIWAPALLHKSIAEMD